MHIYEVILQFHWSTEAVPLLSATPTADAIKLVVCRGGGTGKWNSFNFTHGKWTGTQITPRRWVGTIFQSEITMKNAGE